MENLPKPLPVTTTRLLVALLILASFAIGVLWTKVQYLEGRGGSVAGTKTATTNPTAPSDGGQPPPTRQAGQIRPVTDQDHIRGDRKAKVSLVEYSDLECPFCKRFHPTMQQALKEYAGKVRWVYRHFPLDQIHPKADKEAEATECAGELGGEDSFWRMADKIFEVTPSNNGLSLDDLPNLALQIGLDKNRFKACLDGGKFASRVEEDYQDGIKGGISGTPGTIIIDAKGGTTLIPGALPYENIKQAIEKALQN